MLKIKNAVIAIILIIWFLVGSLFGQTNSPLSPSSWNVVYEIPEIKNVTVTSDVEYYKDSDKSLKIDIYMPPESKNGKNRAAVVFLNGVRSSEAYRSWARLAAAHNLIGITMDANPNRIRDNFRDLFDFLTREGDKYGIDGSRLGVFVASANSIPAMGFLMDEKAAPGIHAAVIYYGSAAPQGKIRKDLSVLYVVAESDLPRAGSVIPNTLWKQVTENAAPWTLVFASRMPHAFDILTDNDESRRLIQQTISFWQTRLEIPPQPSWKPSPNRRIVEALYAQNNELAVELLNKYTLENPSDAQGFEILGQRLQRLNRNDEAAAAFQKALKLVPNNALIYNQLAIVRMALNHNEEAINTFERGIELGLPKAATLYNIACAYVRLKQNEKAFEFLNKAIDEGFSNRNNIENDADLSALRSDARFQQILLRFQAPKP